MNKQKAIDLLNAQIDKLKSREFDPVIWTSSTNSLIRKIFPKSARQKTADLDEISYMILSAFASNTMQNERRKKGIEQAESFVKEFINEIDNFGLEISVPEKKSNSTETNINTDVTGRTIWDVISRLINQKPGIVLITVVSIVIIVLVLMWFGMIKFQIIDNNVIVDVNSDLSKSTTEYSGDKRLRFCLENGNKLKKKYILKSVIQTYDAELIGKNRDTLLVKERIIYDLLALEHITKSQNIFKEEYSSNVAFKVERWYGTEREKQVHMGNESAYYLNFDCKKGESRTIVTGADFYYTFPLSENRSSPFRALILKSNEDLWVYPNDEDVIGKLTMIFSSGDLKLIDIPNGALHSFSNGRGIINDDKDSYYNSDENSIGKNYSVSSTWEDILPDEQFALKLKWLK